MPITVEAVSKADFAKWVVRAKVKFAAERAPEPSAPETTLAEVTSPGRAAEPFK